MNKKTKRIIIILGIVTCLLILGIICYFIFNNANEGKKVKKEEKIEEKAKEEKKDEIAEEEKQKIEKQINDYIALAFSFPIDNVDSLDDQRIFWFLTTKLKDANTGFTKDDLESLMDTYFKKNIMVVYGDIDCPIGDGVFYELDNDSGKYKQVGVHGHGGGTVPRGKAFVREITKDDKYIYVKTQIVYGEPAGDTFGPIINYYTESKYDAQTSANEVYQLNDPKASTFKEEITEEEFNTIKDKVPYTIFTLEINNDEDTTKYGLDSVKIENA